MNKVPSLLDEINVGILSAHAGMNIYTNKHQARGAAMMALGLTMLGVLPGDVFAQATGGIEQGINKGISLANLILKAIAIFVAVGGVCVFIAGVNWAVKKSRPEFATQITTGQIIGALIGGPVLGVVGIVFNMFINSFFGNQQLGTTVTVGQ